MKKIFANLYLFLFFYISCSVPSKNIFGTDNQLLTMTDLYKSINLHKFGIDRSHNFATLDRLNKLYRKKHILIDTLINNNLIDEADKIYNDIYATYNTIVKASGGYNDFGEYLNPFERDSAKVILLRNKQYIKHIESINQYAIKYEKLLNTQGIPITFQHSEITVSNNFLLVKKLSESDIIQINNTNNNIQQLLTNVQMIDATLLLHEQELRLLRIETALVRAIENHILDNIIIQK